MEALHKKPRKGAVRSIPFDINGQIRSVRRKNFEVKRWIQNFYENDRISLEK